LFFPAQEMLTQLALVIMASMTSKSANGYATLHENAHLRQYINDEHFDMILRKLKK
jgi:hypothetical protein